jgi:hypothetical protein
MTPTLELAQDALSGHLALEVLDGPLDAFVADLDLERLTLDCFAGIRQGPGDMTDGAPIFKSPATADPTGLDSAGSGRHGARTWPKMPESSPRGSKRLTARA